MISGVEYNCFRRVICFTLSEKALSLDDIPRTGMWQKPGLDGFGDGDDNDDSEVDSYDDDDGFGISKG